MDSDEFNAVFWSFFITSVIGLLFGLAKMAYKSKCKEVQVCCLKIIRDTDTEEALREPSPSSSQSYPQDTCQHRCC